MIKAVLGTRLSLYGKGYQKIVYKIYKFLIFKYKEATIIVTSLLLGLMVRKHISSSQTVHSQNRTRPVEGVIQLVRRLTFQLTAKLRSLQHKIFQQMVRNGADVGAYCGFFVMLTGRTFKEKRYPSANAV